MPSCIVTDLTEKLSEPHGILSDRKLYIDISSDISDYSEGTFGREEGV